MKKIILCPNPNRDRGMETTRRADAILRQMGFQTVVRSEEHTSELQSQR